LLPRLPLPRLKLTTLLQQLLLLSPLLLLNPIFLLLLPPLLLHLDLCTCNQRLSWLGCDGLQSWRCADVPSP
jgi:hypothetical protein